MGDGCVPERPLVIIPTYNERDNIIPIISAIHRQLPTASVWVVDDNSPDGTGQIVEEIAAEDPRVDVIHRSGKLGLGTAYLEGFRRALDGDFDAIFQMDADFSHDPTYLPQLLDGLRDADMVIGSRYTVGGGTRNWSFARRWISRIGNLIARVGLGITTRDATSGFRAYRRSTIERLRFEDLHLRGYGFQIELAYQVERQGLRIREVPITFVERVSGTSKMSKAIVVEAVLHIMRRRIGMLRSRLSQGRVAERRSG